VALGFRVKLLGRRAWCLDFRSQGVRFSVVEKLSVGIQVVSGYRVTVWGS